MSLGGFGAGLLLVGMAGGMTGCGSGISAAYEAGSGTGTGSSGGTGSGGGVAGGAIHGTVMGAGRPVAGATVMLYGAGSGGNGVGATALLAAGVTTGADGSFAVPAGYSCAASGQELYLVARGGTVAGSAGANSALAEMAMLGTCGAVSATTSYAVSELTTVTGVWAMRPFVTPAGVVGASATDAVGLANAVGNVQQLLYAAEGAVVNANGTVTTTAPGITEPGPKVNVLANLLAMCAANAGSAGCGTVLGGEADTLAAAVAIANAPGARVSELFQAMAGVTPVFTPVLQNAPADWTLAMVYAGGGLIAPTNAGVMGPTAVAIDGGGRAWVLNYGGVLSVLGPTGTPVFATGLTGGGMGDSYGLALDASGNAWVTNTDAGTVTEWSGTGTVLSGATGYGAGDHPVGVAIAPDGTVWIADNGDGEVAKLSGAGAALGTFGAPQMAFPQAVAVDGTGGVWVGNGTGPVLTHVGTGGATLGTVSCCDGVAGLAVDAQGYVWAANYYGDSVSRVSAAGVVDAGGPYTATGLSGPQGIAVDGAGAVWVASLRAAGLTEFAGSGFAALGASAPGAVLSPAGGWATDAGLNQASGVAVDASGDVWVSNFAAGTVTEVVGVATPVKTPLLGPVAVP